MVMSKKTQETCPVCGTEDVKVEHAIDEHDHPVHIWHCPVCLNTGPALVCWACPTCAGVFRDVIDEQRALLSTWPEKRAVNQTDRVLHLQSTYFDILTNEKRVGMNKWVRERVLQFTCFDGRRPNTREEWQAWRNILPWAIQLVGDALSTAEKKGGFVLAGSDHVGNQEKKG